MAYQLVVGGEVIDDILINDEASEIKCKDADGNESDVQTELDKQNKNFENLGIIYKGAWISTSGGNIEKCTETIYLNKGVYIINYHSPVSVDQTIFMSLNIDGYIPDNSHASGIHVARGTMCMEITRDNTPVYVLDGGGKVKTYSFLERGGIEAIKLK